MQKNVCKKIVLEFLAFLRYKVQNDLMTMDEIESLAKMLEESLIVIGTVDDLARFYNQPRTNVSSTINRRMLEKPVRKVFYSFNAFRKIVPSSWRWHKETADIQHSKEKT